MSIEKEDEFEIMPVSELNNLKKEIDQLKKTAVGAKANETISTLNENIKDLLAIFRETTREMREEEEKSETMRKKINTVSDNLDELYEQNAKIAEAMIAIHDTVEEMKSMLDEMRTGAPDESSQMKVNDLMQPDNMDFSMSDTPGGLPPPPMPPSRAQKPEMQMAGVPEHAPLNADTGREMGNLEGYGNRGSMPPQMPRPSYPDTGSMAPSMGQPNRQSLSGPRAPIAPMQQSGQNPGHSINPLPTSAPPRRGAGMDSKKKGLF